tara:strand:+ start:3946 stop:4125 length:180 start_codon:yes stop_codon:yes gene_type:complete
MHHDRPHRASEEQCVVGMEGKGQALDGCYPGPMVDVVVSVEELPETGTRYHTVAAVEEV